MILRQREITDAEYFVVQRLRKIAAEAPDGKGHGTLRVEVNFGVPTLAKRELSEKIPQQC